MRAPLVLLAAVAWLSSLACEAWDSCPANEVVTSTGCSSCQEIEQRMTAAISAALAAGPGCASDQDCKCVSVRSACGDRCDVPVASAGETRFQSSIDRFATANCGESHAAICGRAIPGCLPCRAVCQSGRCEQAPQ